MSPRYPAANVGGSATDWTTAVEEEARAAGRIALSSRFSFGRIVSTPALPW